MYFHKIRKRTLFKKKVTGSINTVGNMEIRGMETHASNMYQRKNTAHGK